MRELVFVDDGSRSEETRDTLAAIARTDERVVLVRSEANQGPGPARNRALAAARCDWIGFLDADDYWMPRRAASFADALAAAPGAMWFAGTRFHLPTTGKLEHASPVADVGEFAERLAPRLWRAAGPSFARWMIGNLQLFLGQTLIRRELLETRPFPSRKMVGTDWLLFMRLAAIAELTLVDEPWFVRRDRVPSITSSSLAVREGSTTMLELAWRMPELAAYRRELRWTRYAEWKRVAASNLLVGDRRRAFSAALRALALDPREMGDFVAFCHAALLTAPEGRAARITRYSGAPAYKVLGE